MNFIEKNLTILLITLVSTFVILFFTYDIIITIILSAYYCSQAPNPKTKIIKKVAYPISIYWDDNVYPGFSKEDRELMIKNYLDGVHLKTMALNAPDNKIYVYSKEVPKKEYMVISHKISSISKEIKRMHTFLKDKQNKQYIKDINKLYKQRESLQAKQIKLINSYPVSEKIFTKQTMPKLNYTVTFNEIKLNSFARHFLYSDETKVIENNTSKVIAYNRRYMRFFYNIFPDVALGNRYYSEAMCGGKIFTPYWVFGYIETTSDGKIKLTDKVGNTGIHKLSRNQKLYNKYIKGEK